MVLQFEIHAPCVEDESDIFLCRVEEGGWITLGIANVHVSSMSYLTMTALVQSEIY